MRSLGLWLRSASTCASASGHGSRVGLPAVELAAAPCRQHSSQNTAAAAAAAATAAAEALAPTASPTPRSWRERRRRRGPSSCTTTRALNTQEPATHDQQQQQQQQHSFLSSLTSMAPTEPHEAAEGRWGSTAPLVPPSRPVVIIVSGPSGVGKDAVVQRLKEAREDLYFVVTATSRAMRPNEVEGRDYFFVDRPKFESWIEGGMLLEHANVYGDYKGIPRQQVDDALKSGTDVVLRIDVQGAATVKRLMPQAITIFVAAESEASLVARLAARKTEDAEKLALRMDTARLEMARVAEFDYVVVNSTGKMEQCVAQMSCIIDAEKSRTSNRYSTAATALPAANSQPSA